jgi:hypothetical protein
MFALTRPCAKCPFRDGQGELFQLQRERLEEIFEAPAFQCHNTVDYSTSDDNDGEGKAGDRPQQCAGLMAVLNREGRPNQIMQVASRLGALDLDQLDPRNEAYASIAEVLVAHGHDRF